MRWRGAEDREREGTFPPARDFRASLRMRSLPAPRGNAPRWIGKRRTGGEGGTGKRVLLHRRRVIAFATRRDVSCDANARWTSKCERCKAEYEFDDALVSGRGTTVKCTGCGYQFKIRRGSDRPDSAPDRWLVRTTEGARAHLHVAPGAAEGNSRPAGRARGCADARGRTRPGSRRYLGARVFLRRGGRWLDLGSETCPRRSRRHHRLAPQDDVVAPPAADGAPSRTRPPRGGDADASPGDASSRRPDASAGQHDSPPATEAAVPPPSTKPGPLSALTDDSTVGPAPQGAAVSVAPVISAGNLAGIPAPMPLPLAPSMTGTTEHTPPMPMHVHSSEPPPLPLRAAKGAAHGSIPRRGP